MGRVVHDPDVRLCECRRKATWYEVGKGEYATIGVYKCGRCVTHDEKRRMPVSEKRWTNATSAE